MTVAAAAAATIQNPQLKCSRTWNGRRPYTTKLMDLLLKNILEKKVKLTNAVIDKLVAALPEEEYPNILIISFKIGLARLIRPFAAGSTGVKNRPVKNMDSIKENFPDGIYFSDMSRNLQVNPDETRTAAKPKTLMAIKKLPEVNPERTISAGTIPRISVATIMNTQGMNSDDSRNIHIIIVAENIVRKYFRFHSSLAAELTYNTDIGITTASIQPTGLSEMSLNAIFLLKIR